LANGGLASLRTYQATRVFLMAIEKAKSLNDRIMRAVQGIEDPTRYRTAFSRARMRPEIDPAALHVPMDKIGGIRTRQWKILKKYAAPQDALLPCTFKANYDKMKY